MYVGKIENKAEVLKNICLLNVSVKLNKEERNGNSKQVYDTFRRLGTRIQGQGPLEDNEIVNPIKMELENNFNKK